MGLRLISFVLRHCCLQPVLDDLEDIKDCVGIKDFHELKGSRKGIYSIHVTGNYCITFKWDGEHAYDLDFEDYH